MKGLYRINSHMQRDAALQNYLFYAGLALAHGQPELVARYNPNPGGAVNHATTKRLDRCSQNIAAALGVEWDDEAYLGGEA
jgi:hypothetical protein